MNRIEYKIGIMERIVVLSVKDQMKIKSNQAQHVYGDKNIQYMKFKMLNPILLCHYPQS